MQDSQSQADHLQILTSGGSRDVARLGANIVDNGSLQPGNQEMRAFVDDLLLHTRQPVEDDGSSSTLDIVQRSVDGHGPHR